MTLYSPLEVCLLGRFDVRRAGKAVDITSRPAQSLFAYLILNAGTSHRREKLAGMLWPDSLEETARNNLRHALWRLRKALPSGPDAQYLLVDDLSITFNATSAYWLDAAELERLPGQASADDLISALSNYVGELLPGFYDEWVVLEREHLSSIYEHQMARLMSLLEEQGRWLDILDWGERWIKLGQKPEPAYRALMRAHAAKGDMSKVATTYERCVRSMGELGVEPSEATRALYESIKAGREPFEAGSTVRAKEKLRASPKTNLPDPITSFIGRQKEVQEVVKLIATHRLVTLMGPGGVGKTRLAIQSSNRLLSKFRDGVWWVELAGLSDPALVPQAVAKAVSANEIPNQPLIESLIEHFQARQVLLLLDNCEHLISACAQLADQLLGACKDLKILGTSREAMDLLGETSWSVPSLSLPTSDDEISIKSLREFEGIRLFIERASLVQPGFELTEQNMSAVLQICNRLSGIPLAIELAAARMKIMPADQIARRLDDRFDLLTSGNRAAVPHHQTLRATIDWSYDLLSENERILFRRLSIFAGSFTLDAAEAVTAGSEIARSQIVDLLGQLVNKSLVAVKSGGVDAAGEMRFSLLETIREYARTKLTEADDATLLADRHLSFFLQLAEQAEPKLTGPEQAWWFVRLEPELDNLRGALQWSMKASTTAHPDLGDRALELGLRLAGALAFFWERNYRREAVIRIKQLLSIPSEGRIGRAKAMMALGFLLWAATEYAGARPYLEQAGALAEEIGDMRMRSWSLACLGASLVALGEYGSARAYLEKALFIGRSIGDDGAGFVAWALAFLGDIPFAEGKIASAKDAYLGSLSLARQAGDINFMTYPYRRLGYLAIKERKYEEAEIYLRESLRLNQEINHLQGINRCLAAFAGLRAAEGDVLEAVQMCAAVEGYLQKAAATFFHWDEEFFRGVLSNLRAEVEPDAFKAAWDNGSRMTLDQAVQFALKATYA